MRTEFARLILPVALLAAIGLCAGCEKPPAAGQPTTMEIFLAPGIYDGLDTGTIEQDLYTLFVTNAFTQPVDGRNPLPLAQPPLLVHFCDTNEWFDHWRPNEDPPYAFPGQTPQQFVVKEGPAFGLIGFGRALGTYNAAQVAVQVTTGVVTIRSLEGRWFNQILIDNYIQWEADPNFEWNETVSAHAVALTIAHELGWHKLANEGDEGPDPVNVGTNEWRYIVEPPPIDPAHDGFVWNGAMPPWLEAGIEALQRRMGYYVED